MLHFNVILNSFKCLIKVFGHLLFALMLCLWLFSTILPFKNSCIKVLVQHFTSNIEPLVLTQVILFLATQRLKV